MRTLIITLSAGLLFIPIQRATAADVLYIGDSHSADCFGEGIYENLRQHTNPATGQYLTVRSEATCSSTAQSWLDPAGSSTTCGYRSCDPEDFDPCNFRQIQQRGLDRCKKNENCLYDVFKGQAPPFDTLLSKSPKLTIVALGTNMLTTQSTMIDQEMADAATIIRKILARHSQCLWIGPPQPLACKISKVGYESFVARLKATVESHHCTFVDSDPLSSRENIVEWQTVKKTGKRIHNCVHFECPAGRQWAQKVSSSSSFERALTSAFPSRNEPPADGTAGSSPTTAP